MNRSVEDRLVAALEARAQLVTPEDLGPLEVPDRRRLPRRGVVLLLTVAASAAAVAAPFVLTGGDGGSSDPDPAAPPSVGVPEPTESGPTEPVPTEPVPTEPQPSVSVPPGPEPTKSIVSGRQRADVDGDGRPDQVLVIHHGPTLDEPAEGTVRVTLASGTRGSAVALPLGYPPTVLPAFDINRDGREQVLLSHTAGGDSAALIVIAWQGGGLVSAQTEGQAPLALDLDGQGRVNHYYTDDRGLFSWLRLDPVDPAVGRVFHVDQWSWSLDGDRLIPTPAEPACVDVTTEDAPRPCSE